MRRLLFFILCLLIAGCVADPVAPSGPDVPPAPAGVFVVNEGLWRRDNANITFFDPLTGLAAQDYFAVRNPGMRLGDLANSIQVHDGRAYIAVSTSRTIEAIECSTGRSLGRLHLAYGNEPRRIAFADSTRAFASCFGDSIAVFDPRSLTLDTMIATGPAPEGIAAAEGSLFVANSGLGKFRQNESGASTIAVLDARTLAMRNWIETPENPRDLRYVESVGRLYVLYGLSDSTGGVMELNPRTLAETKRWNVNSVLEMAIDERALRCYVVGVEGLVVIDLAGPSVEPRILIPAAAWPRTIFYSVGCAPDGSIYLGTVKNYATPGEVLVFTPEGELRQRFPCGVNPGSYGFY